MRGVATIGMVSHHRATGVPQTLCFLAVWHGPVKTDPVHWGTMTMLTELCAYLRRLPFAVPFLETGILLFLAYAAAVTGT